MKKVLLAALMLSVMLFAATAQANLITNGSFDTGLDGWDNSLLSTMPGWNDAAQAAEFSYDPLLIGAASQSLYQIFRIEPGTKSLTLSFDLTSNVYPISGWQTGSFTVSFNSFDFSLNDFTIYEWTDEDGNITANISKEIEFNDLIGWFDMNNAALIFQFSGFGVGYGDGISVLLDNVMLTAGGSNAVPIPGAIWLLGSGIAGLVALRRKNAA